MNDGYTVLLLLKFVYEIIELIEFDENEQVVFSLLLEYDAKSSSQ